jgi:hypothetical protein
MVASSRRVVHTGNTDNSTGSKACHSLIVAVVLLAQVAGGVQCELICGSHAGCASISSVQLRQAAVVQLRTVKCNYASRPGDDAHGSNILLAEGVLHPGNQGADGRSLEGGARCVGKSIAGVEGGVLVGHGGRFGRRCRLPRLRALLMPFTTRGTVPGMAWRAHHASAQSVLAFQGCIIVPHSKLSHRMLV